jgi:hypothetical protein
MVAMRVAVLVAVWTLTLVVRSGAQPTHAITGQAGILGEWDLTATVTEQPDSGGRRWRGTLSMRHVGFCSVDGPEERTGELRLLMPGAPRETSATLLIDGTECTFRGHLGDGRDGVLACPDRPDVPMILMIQ